MAQLLILDACVTINLIASGVDLEELATPMGVRFAMTRIAASEVLHLAPTEAGGAREQIDVFELASRGALVVVDLQGEEVARYVQFARSVDDGEAATIAVASCRSVDLATDDRKGRRLAQSVGVRTVGTAALLRAWYEGGQVGSARVARALLLIERRASYFPSQDDPDLSWWEENR